MVLKRIYNWLSSGMIRKRIFTSRLLMKSFFSAVTICRPFSPSWHFYGIKREPFHGPTHPKNQPKLSHSFSFVRQSHLFFAMAFLLWFPSPRLEVPKNLGIASRVCQMGGESLARNQQRMKWREKKLKGQPWRLVLFGRTKRFLKTVGVWCCPFNKLHFPTSEDPQNVIISSNIWSLEPVKWLLEMGFD